MHIQIYVGEQVKFGLEKDEEGWVPKYMQTFNPVIDINPSTTYSLTIDVSEHTNDFKYQRNYYFRVGALASVSGVGTIRHNYAPYVVIRF